MNPTQYELATLASAMPSAITDPAAASRQALALWDSCGDELSRRKSSSQRRDTWLESDREWMAVSKFSGTVEFGDFLREIDGKSKPSTMAKRLQRYLVEAHKAHVVATGQWIEPSRMEELTDRQIAEWKKNGMKVEECVNIAPLFRGFILSDAEEQRRSRASKGGEGRAAAKSQTPDRKEKAPNTKKTLEPAILPRSKAKSAASKESDERSGAQARKWVSRKVRNHP